MSRSVNEVLFEAVKNKLQTAHESYSKYRSTMEDGKRMVCKEYKSGFLPFGTSKAEVIITLTDDMTVKITDNAQVLDDAVFV